jgi:putative ABC transport system permease protein
MALVLVESCAIAAVGGLAGLGAAWLLTAGGSPVPAMLPVFYIPHQSLLLGVGFVFALGIAVGLVPALQAMRLPVAVALRRHG